jgi:hypothetical protein
MSHWNPAVTVATLTGFPTIALGRTETVALTMVVVLADAGYWHQREMQQLAGEGSRPMPGCAASRIRAGPAACMRSCARVLATPLGHELCRQRPITSEPVFGQIKFNRAIKRFRLNDSVASM